jgi:uncharacterized protein (TIGR02118 family)
VVKAIYFFRRREGIPVEDFQKYWRSVHADLMRKVPGLKCYVQCHTLLSGYRRHEPPCLDGVEEISFDSTEQLAAMDETSAGRATMEDMLHFVSIERVQKIVAEEIEIKPGAVRKDMVKNIELVTRKRGMPPLEFHAYWRDVHGPIAAKIGVIKRYVQSHTLMEEYKKEVPPAYDGVAETWFDDTTAMRRSAATLEYVTTRSDEKNFLTEPLPFIITREVKII